MDSFVESFDCLKAKKCCSESELNSLPIVVLKPLSDKQILKYDKDFFDKYINKEVVETNEDITQSDLMRCLGLISTKDLESKEIISLKQSFPNRSIARIGDQLTDGSNRKLLDKNLIIQ